MYGREENMDNINVNLILEDLKSMRENLKGLLEKADRIEKSVWELKEVSRKERDPKKKQNYKDELEEVEFHLKGLRKGIKDLEDSDLFRDKINIPKHKR